MSGSETIAIRHGLSIQEFISLYNAGQLSLDNASQFSALVAPPPPGILADPAGETYASWVMSVWKEITGRTRYRPDVDEAFDLPLEQFLRRPWPHHSGSAVEVGNYMGAISWLFRVIQPRPGDRIVEFGSGWGLLALNLAMFGCNVTAVDLNEDSIALLRRRSELWGVSLDLVRATFLEYAASECDLILFFEAFHHCNQPLELLTACRRYLRPGGRVVFLAEPIYEAFYCPWGVRLDGHAIFMARQFGWLELGFEHGYFLNQLTSRGFHVAEHKSPDLGAFGTMLVATAT
jgi:SAM-dependent methyltransferase